MPGTSALPPGAVLDGRFEIQSTLGRGGFSIAYLATDLTQHDECVVKELAPTGAERIGSQLDLSSVPSTNPQRLRKRFLEEANLIAGLKAPGILHLREAFEDNGTAYFVTDMLPGARTLDRVLAQEGRLASDETQDILFQLLDILEAVHEQKVLHRDIKPSNILLSPKGEVFLIDFGAAREWHADSAAIQTVLFTPGYAPIEQLSDRGRRGPATDIYALCATAYHILAGYPPRPSAERADGTEIEPLSKIRPDLDVPLVQAITAGLRLRFQERPQSIAELRAILLVPDPNEPDSTTLEHYDAAALRLKKFSYSRHECPVCGGVLESSRPLRTGACPVCREGLVKMRHLPETLCPSCKTGVLQHVFGKTPLLFCPFCKLGRLSFHRRGLLLNRWHAQCPHCDAEMEGDALQAKRLGDEEGESKPWEYWREQSGRANEAWICDVCDHQYEVLANGRRVDILESGAQGQAYYPDEWARIAAGLKPDAGNAFCDTCNADYYKNDDSLTLLSAPTDPFRYAARYLERPIELASVPWLGSGKTSGNKGTLCPQCDTEFDDDHEFLRLVHSPSVRLSRLGSRSLVMEDWQRLAQGLPITSEEKQFFEKLDASVREAYLNGGISFDGRNESMLWNGRARELSLEDGQWVEVGDGNLYVSSSEVIFSRLLRKWRAPFSSVADVHGEGDILTMGVSGEPAGKAFSLEPAELVVNLDSGDRSLWIDAELLAEKMSITECFG